MHLLYLGFVLPEVVAKEHRGWCPAGQGFESAMIEALRLSAKVSVVSFTPQFVEFEKVPSTGQELYLFENESRGALIERLSKWYEKQMASEEPFTHILCYNLTPLYNLSLIHI